MKQCHCSHKVMDIGISCVVIHFHVCKKFFWVLALMSSSSELSEYTGVLSGSWSLLELKDSCQHTGLVGVCGEL